MLENEAELWVFLKHQNVPLTNNEVKLCLRDSVILRKICFGTASHRGDQFRSRILSVVETCKKRGLWYRVKPQDHVSLDEMLHRGIGVPL